MGVDSEISGLGVVGFGRVGLTFRVSGLRVQGLGFSAGFMVYGSGLKVLSLGSAVRRRPDSERRNS